MTPRLPLLLGYAGLLPMAWCLWAAWLGGAEVQYTGLAIGIVYAALIYSFLGGMWWGIGAAAHAAGRAVPPWLWFAAVVPSLVALASFLPWVFGQTWPGPSLVLLAIGLVTSPLVDRKLAHLAPAWWMRLRWPLSLGLGGGSLLLSLAS